MTYPNTAPDGISEEELNLACEIFRDVVTSDAGWNFLGRSSWGMSDVRRALRAVFTAARSPALTTTPEQEREAVRQLIEAAAGVIVAFSHYPSHEETPVEREDRCDALNKLDDARTRLLASRAPDSLRGTNGT